MDLLFLVALAMAFNAALSFWCARNVRLAREACLANIEELEVAEQTRSDTARLGRLKLEVAESLQRLRFLILANLAIAVIGFIVCLYIVTHTDVVRAWFIPT